MSHAIRHNGRVPWKLSGWPKYERYEAPERFQQIARMLGLPAETPEQAVAEYAKAVERLREAIGIEPSLQALGVDEQEFLAALPDMAVAAYEDQTAPANPRMPMFADLEAVMRSAHYGAWSRAPA
jgi:acetaldehyde dehydrogenase/alcohol dehydrogenase